MNGYALSVFAICLVGGVLILLSHGSGRAERVVVGIVTLYIIISPLGEGLSDFDVDRWLESLRGEGVEVSPEYEEVLEQSFSDGIKNAVAEKFLLKREDIRVKLSGFDAENMRSERIFISLSGTAALADYKAVKKYIEGLDLGECELEIEIG